MLQLRRRSREQARLNVPRPHHAVSRQDVEALKREARLLRQALENAQDTLRVTHETALRFKHSFENEQRKNKVQASKIAELEQRLGIELSGAVSVSDAGGEVSLAPEAGSVSISPVPDLPQPQGWLSRFFPFNRST